MKNTTLKALVVTAIMTFAAPGFTYADIVFDHNFENGTAGDLSAGGALGTPAVGSISATGGFVSGTRPAYTTGSNANDNVITTLADGTFNDVGTPAGNYLTVNLSSAAAVTGFGAGETTTVDFNLASFGTNNDTNFKYGHIRGLSSTGAEVFQILWRSGSGSGLRELYARELGEDNTTFVGGVYDSVDGTKVLDGISFGMNSTNTGAAPSGQVTVGITFDQNGWDVTGGVTGGAVTVTDALDLGIASGAADLASIEFFSSVATAGGANNQNNGLWVDNILVETDLLAVPEPSSLLVLLAGGIAFGFRRRRS